MLRGRPTFVGHGLLGDTRLLKIKVKPDSPSVVPPSGRQAPQRASEVPEAVRREE